MPHTSLAVLFERADEPLDHVTPAVGLLNYVSATLPRPALLAARHDANRRERQVQSVGTIRVVSDKIRRPPGVRARGLPPLQPGASTGFKSRLVTPPNPALRFMHATPELRPREMRPSAAYNHICDVRSKTSGSQPHTHRVDQSPTCCFLARLDCTCQPSDNCTLIEPPTPTYTVSPPHTRDKTHDGSA